MKYSGTLTQIRSICFMQCIIKNFFFLKTTINKEKKLKELRYEMLDL